MGSDNHAAQSGPFGQRLPRRRLLSLAGSAALASFIRLPAAERASAQSSQADRSVRHVLPNGLTVLVDERRTAETVALQLTNRDGARNDVDLPGISVLTSRMMFQGTARRPSETDLQRAAAAVGGSFSRGTATELSSFSSVVPSREVEVAFDLLSDVALNALLAPDALARQKQIAFQEIAQRRATPNSYSDELFTSAIFEGHPAATPVLGTTESIASITPETIAAWRDAMWTASRLVLTIVGRVAVQDAIAAAERYFGALPAGTPAEVADASPTPPEGPREVSGVAGQAQAVFRVGFLAPSLLEPDRYPMQVLNGIMTGTSGRLYGELRRAQGLAYVAGSGYSALSDTGAWFATAGVDPQNVDQAIDIVRAQIEELRAEPPTDDETSLQQNGIAGRQILADEANSARASRLASRELLGTEPTEEYVRRIRAVTPEDVLRVAQTYFDPDRSLVVVVGPDMSGGAAQ
jgi:zinc protease